MDQQELEKELTGLLVSALANPKNPASSGTIRGILAAVVIFALTAFGYDADREKIDLAVGFGLSLLALGYAAYKRVMDVNHRPLTKKRAAKQQEQIGAAVKSAVDTHAARLERMRNPAPSALHANTPGAGGYFEGHSRDPFRPGG